jgi:putative flippase GtrA
MRSLGHQEACPRVSSIRELYSRFRQLIHEGAKFLVVGAVGAILTFGIANALHGMGKYSAITVATIIATAATYAGNRWWSFSHRQGQGNTRDTVIFFVLNGVGLLIYYGCIWLIQDVGGLKGKLWYNVALIVGTGLGTLFRFWSYRKWIWTLPTAAAEGPPEQESLTPATTASSPATTTSSSAIADSTPPASASRPTGAHRRS